MTLMTTAEKAKAIRATLKANSINNRQVSVKASTGYSDSVWVTVKDEALDLKEIEKLVNGYESFTTDIITGEILSGGNTFVFVQRA